jgi:hypothetical protein
VQRSFLPAPVPASAVVFLVEGRAGTLSGRCVDARDELAAIVAQAERIVADDTYQLRVVR